jgi:hypothetical protein
MELTEHDRYIIAAALQQIVLLKKQHLRPRAWAIFRDVWLPRAVDQIDQNDFVCNHPDRNFFSWFADQMLNTDTLGGMFQGVNRPFITTELGQQAEEICQQARLGQRHYDRWSQERLGE